MPIMYSEDETKRLVDASVAVGENLMPYVNRELLQCLYLIQCDFSLIKHYDIRPERYWHGSIEEYQCLIILMADGYPNKEVLLEMAKRPTGGALQNICSHFFQTIEVMFNHVQVYEGYDVLRPTEYMLTLYPDAREKYYVYPHEFWAHMEIQQLAPAFLVIDESELDVLPALMKKRCGIC